MKAKEKELAVGLRRKGSTYSEILSKVNVSKGTLSLWLRDVEVPDGFLSRITDRKAAGREKAGNALKNRWRLRHDRIKKDYNPPYDNPFFMLGLGIYIGEGAKYSRSEVRMGYEQLA